MADTVESLSAEFMDGVQANFNGANASAQKYAMVCGFEGEQLKAIGVLLRELDERLRDAWYRCEHLTKEGYRSPRAAEELAGDK